MMELMCENEYCRVVSFETPSDPKPERPCPGCGQYGDSDKPVEVMSEEDLKIGFMVVPADEMMKALAEEEPV